MSQRWRRRAAVPAHAQPGGLAGMRPGRTIQVAFAVVAGLALVGTALDGGAPTGRAAAAAPPPRVPAAASPAASAFTAASSSPVSSTTGTAPTGPGMPSTSSAARFVDDAAVSELAASGIPATALLAYQQAAAQEDTLDPACHLPWELLAAIGRVESNHGRFAGAVLHTDGLSTPRIIGIPLNGHGTALIRDTDHGRLDGDTVYDRAVGPMQFIPSTWARYAADGNGDGIADPFNIFDAAAAAARYLCAAGGDLATAAGQTRAVLAYNHSAAYVAEVLAIEARYAAGGVAIAPTSPLPAIPTMVPPVDPGRPPSIGTTSPGPPGSPDPPPSMPPGATGPGTTGPSTSATPVCPPSSPAGGSPSTTASPTQSSPSPSPAPDTAEPSTPTSSTVTGSTSCPTARFTSSTPSTSSDGTSPSAGSTDAPSGDGVASADGAS